MKGEAVKVGCFLSFKNPQHNKDLFQTEKDKYQMILLIYNVWKTKQDKTELTDTENRLVSEGSQKVQTPSYKLTKSQECNIQHGNYN